MNEERDQIDEEELPPAGNSDARLYPKVEDADPEAESDPEEPQGDGGVPREGEDQDDGDG